MASSLKFRVVGVGDAGGLPNLLLRPLNLNDQPKSMAANMGP